ncbi:MAG: YbcC family protein [Sphingomonas sp.]
MTLTIADTGAAERGGGLAETVAINAAIDGACAKIAPLWPLSTFVAVNPFLGFVDRPFEEACVALRRIGRVDMLPPPLAPAGMGVAAEMPPAATVTTLAELLDGLAGGDRQASRTAFMIDEISRWCAAYFDEGQAVWRAPSRRLGLYAGWKAAMAHDLNAEAMGIAGFRATVAATPDDPRAAIAMVVEALGVPPQAREDYLFRALFDIRGWASFARQKVWTSALYDRPDTTLVELLAVRVVWGYALYQSNTDPIFRAAWAEAMATAARPADPAMGGAGIAGRLAALHDAETRYQRELIAALQPAPSGIQTGERPPLQAAFCIDVRSEVYRRALEMVWPGVETLGFAGFYGFPIEYVPIGRSRGGAQCPVLLTPKFVVREGVKGMSADEEAGVLGLRRLRRRLFKAWKAFKLSAVSSFSFVETAGLIYAVKLVGDALGLTRPVAHPRSDGLSPGVAARLGPHIAAETQGGRATGFGASERVDMAEAVLRAMSLTQGFARLVLLAGHGATTVNNPHAAGLDCGACGGHSGEANARVAAAILNDPEVRDGLAARGIVVPDDTVFVAALHDTTTDEVALFDLETAPATHREDLAVLRRRLSEAAGHTRLLRATRLGIAPDRHAHAAIVARSRDWSQVRPEWGLAGCAAFIAGPRSITRQLNLQGRAFLHGYDWRQDKGFATLELIMTAPMVVASWINLQYYGSTVNNAAFGAGDKVLHNVVGTVGVLEGNAGDLKAGLPLQSVHDGRDFVHDPLRLTVVIAAPIAAIDGVIARHDSVRHLVDHGWLHLFAIDEAGVVRARVRGAPQWSDWA